MAFHLTPSGWEALKVLPVKCDSISDTAKRFAINDFSCGVAKGALGMKLPRHSATKKADTLAMTMLGRGLRLGGMLKTRSGHGTPHSTPASVFTKRQF